MQGNWEYEMDDAIEDSANKESLTETGKKLSKEELYKRYHDIPDGFSDWVYWFVDRTDEKAKELVDILFKRFYEAEYSSPEQEEKAGKKFDSDFDENILAHWKNARFNFELTVLYRMKQERKFLFGTEDFIWGKAFLEKKVQWCQDSIENKKKNAGQIGLDGNTLRSRMKWRGYNAAFVSFLNYLAEKQLIDPNWVNVSEGSAVEKADTKIIWRGKENQLAVLFQWLAAISPPMITEDWQQIASTNFEKPDGKPISKNLSKLAGNKNGRKLNEWFKETTSKLNSVLGRKQNLVPES